MAEVDCVAGLHAHEGAPGDCGAAVEDAGDDVAEEEVEVAPCCADVGGEVAVEAGGEDGRCRFVGVVVVVASC